MRGETMAFSWWAVMCASCAALVLSSRHLMHLFQLESYQFMGYFRSLKRNLRQVLLESGALALGHVLVYLLSRILGAGAWVILYASLLVLLGWLLFRYEAGRKEKKKLAYTARIKRLLVAQAQTYLVLEMLFSRAVLSGIQLLLAILFPLLVPIWFALAALVVLPVEKGIQELYFRDAQKMLKDRPDLIKIGITGSYGKTSVKFILGTLLSEKYQTLVTPSSFNTPMGLTKVIRSSLLPSHQVFVAEMGARHVGDIRELCRLVHPSLGVLTSVGAQHLDTFRTVERIRDTKYELMESLPESGTCFFVDDHAICRELYDKTQKEKWLVALSPETRADVWAEEVEVGPFGSRFKLCTKGGSVACETRLLGEHAIANILLSAAVCLKLHMTLMQIARGIARLEPVEHRLQLVQRPGGITIIDDAFNSNPAGSSAALRVLARFPGRRIIITPGMVELGHEEAHFNREFGRQMAKSTDVVILVGTKHTSPIREGLLEEGFAEESMYTVQSLTQAAQLLGDIAQEGDTVLFENDLPDNYSEV